MTCVGALRIKNEARWIEEVIRSILPVCERVFVFDDHSTDGTQELVRSIPECVLIESQFEGLDETRDKDFLYGAILNAPQYRPDVNGFHYPDWVLMIDGDEVLEERDVRLLHDTMEDPKVEAIRMRIIYLWNDRQHQRVDGVYRNFNRPSAWRVTNPSFRFQSTPNGGNMHCSSVPQELLGKAVHSEVRLNHLGYMNREDRLRKYGWYNKVDPHNAFEDYYRHMVQGDLPSVPAFAKLRHAGPLEIIEI